MIETTPIKKFVVLTHLLYSGITGGFTSEVEEKMMKEVDAIIAGNADEPGTHFIVSVIEGRPLDPRIAELISRIPQDRVHMPRREGSWHNYFGEDAGLQEEIGKRRFSGEVEIESYGNLVDMCAASNARMVADFVSKKAKLKQITILGGAWDSEEITRVSFGVKQALPQQARYAFHNFEADTVRAEDIVKKTMGSHADKLVYAWPRKYKLRA